MPIIQGTGASETLNGTEGADHIFGLEGDDTLNGLGGADVLDGGPGQDLLQGGLGADLYIVDDPLDRITELTGQGDDRISSYISYELAAGASVETITTMNSASTAAITLTGNEFGQSIYGNVGDNILNGLGGADYLVGLGGNDRYIVDNPLDVITEMVDQGDDWLSAESSYTLRAGISVETMNTTNAADTEAINLTGNDFGQSIYGNAGDNILNGRGGADYLLGLDGNDILIDGPGPDRLVGGDGADIFIFSALGFDNVIVDFVSGVDKIDLGDLLPPDFFTFIGAGEFTGGFGEGRYENGLFELDVNRDRVPDLTIEVTGPLTATDFIIVGSTLSGAGAWDYW